MPSNTDLRHRAFRALSRFTLHRPWWVLAFAVVSAIAAIVITKARLEFHTGQDDLISANNRDSRNYLGYIKEFPDLDGLIVVVRAQPDYARAELFADALGNRLSHDSTNVKTVFYRIDPDLFADRALLYLSRPELDELSQKIREHRDFLVRYAANPGLEPLFKIINGEVNHAMASNLVSGLLDSPPPVASSDSSVDLSFLNQVLAGAVQNGARFQSPFDQLTQSGGQTGLVRDGYVASDNNRYLLMYVAPGDGAANGPDPVEVIQKYVNQVRALFPDVDAGMTGGPALAQAEASSTAHDIALASVLAIVSNALLIIIPFGSLIKPLFALAALLIGVAWSFGFTTVAVGHLNLLSAVFTSVLAGIGINFPIHLMARYEEARRQGRAVGEALDLAVANTGIGVVASAFIMALTFITPMLTDFKGIAELGLISAAGLFLCLLSAMLVFPALVVIQDRRRGSGVLAQPDAEPRAQAKSSWLEPVFRRPAVPIIISTIVAIASLVFAGRVHFDQNLLKLQAESSEAVKFEKKLLMDSGRSSWFAVAMARDRKEAERKAQAFTKLPEVAEAETIGTYIPEAQSEKREVLGRLKQALGEIAFNPATPYDPPQLLAALKQLQFKLAGAPRNDSPPALRDSVRLLALAIGKLEAEPLAFRAYEQRMANDFAQKMKMFERNLAPGALTEENLPQVLRSRFIGASGTYLVQVYPRGDIWDDAPLLRFVTAVRSVDRDVTGPPLQTFNIATIMRRGYERAALIALIAVLVFVLADFRNLRDTALATVPLIYGFTCLLGLMGLMGWEFNLANLFAVPIIIGMAVDNGVNMVYRWREEADKEALILSRAVGKSVTICSLTTIAGFAALIPATHRGISSLGWVLSLGVGTVLVATLVILPALFRILGRGTAGAGQSPARDQNQRPQLKLAASGRTLLIATFALAAISFASTAHGAEAAKPSPAPGAGLLSHSGDKLLAEGFIKDAEEMINAAGKTDPLDTAGVRAAIQKLRDALDLQPNNDTAYIDLGFAYSVLKEPNVAIDMYRKATELNPTGANFTELADIYLRAGQPEEALMAANAGLAKDSRNARLYNARGMAMHDLTRFYEAQRDFQRALQLDPTLVAAKANLEALSAQIPAKSTISKAPAAGAPARPVAADPDE